MKKSVRPKESFFKWWHILNAQACPHCERALPRPDHGLRRAFCPACTASLPRVIGLHLDRAIRSDWFIAWWRLAMKWRRTDGARREMERERGAGVASFAKAGGGA